ncbi:MAG: hypothetical protein GEV06_12240 [Luteitalea sp.]|nr:hypothetical protein [Luteitalea sp.]
MTSSLAARPGVCRGNLDEQGSRVPADATDLTALFHRLNNQLGVILAHAELLQVRAGDEQSRSRASEVVRGALDALTTTREIREQWEGSRPSKE